MRKLLRRIRFSILVLSPIRVRMFWRNVLRWFGVNSFEMAIDDLHDSLELFRLRIGYRLAEHLLDETVIFYGDR